MSELVTGHTTPAATAPAKQDVPIRSLPAPLKRFGLFSAMAMAITYTVFLLGFFANSASLFPRPWDQIIAVGASLLIAPSFVLMMVAVHHAAPDAKKMWTQAAMAFAVLYAGRPVNLFWALFMEFGDPPMARRMLKGIKARAERMDASSGDRDGASVVRS